MIERCSRKLMVCGILVAGLAWSAIGNAQQTEAPSAEFRSGVHGPFPNVDLLAHVVAPEGKLSFFADFSHPEKEGCPIYLVNRTDRVMSVPVQDGRLFVALAAQMPEGVWQRAQVHEFSTCGNSYYSLVLPPGQHFKSFGYRPEAGEAGKVRYQFFAGMENLASNEGTGFWNPADLACHLKAEREGARIEQSLLSLMDGVPDKLEGGISTKAENAMLWLELAGRHRQDGAYFSGIELVRRIIQNAKGSEPGKLAGLTARLDALASRRPPQLSATALRQECEAIIRSAPPKSNLVAGKPHRSWVAWEVALSLLRNESGKEQIVAGDWKELFKLAQARLPDADVYEAGAIGQLLRHTRLTSENVKSDFLMTHATSPIYAVREACLEQLAARQMFDQLAEIGMKVSPELRLCILRRFCAEPKAEGGPTGLRGVYGRQEEFWKTCIKEDPWGSMHAMQWLVGNNEHFYMEPWLSLLFRERFTMLLDTAQAGVFPMLSYDQSMGLREYVKVVNRDAGIGTIRMLKRAVDLMKSGPADEPKANAEARKSLANAAAGELRLEEFFR